MPTHGLQAISGHKWDNASTSELAKTRDHISYLCSIYCYQPANRPIKHRVLIAMKI